MTELFPSRLPDLGPAQPHLSARAAGWLRHIYRKATTTDDWSEDGNPASWWDQKSQEPLLSFPRFDLSESSYAIGVMADQTPAWREVYAEILDGLVERHITYWAAVDWLTQFGHDPRRAHYPQQWIDDYIPERLVGAYDTPGWVANGIAPHGLQPDPIGADGNLFFKGWLNLIQSMHAYVTGEDKWGNPFLVAGVGRTRFEWTQHRMVDLLASQWTEHPLGPHCENTKIWPYCLSAAGLGLKLYDSIFDQSSHSVFDRWLAETKQRFYSIDDTTGCLKGVVFYHDPVIDHTQWQPPLGALPVCFYLAPQEPVFAEYLYHAAVSSLGWNDPKKPIVAGPEPRRLAVAMTVAREFGDEITTRRLTAFAEENFEPKFFGDGEFGFWFGLGEQWPRGQLSACAMVSEVGGPGAWVKLFRQPDLAKFSEPTVEGVDYPALGIVQAYNDPDTGVLHVGTYAGDSARVGQDTTFRVSRLPDSARVTVRCDGAQFHHWRVVGPDEIAMESTIGTHVFEIVTGRVGSRAPWQPPTPIHATGPTPGRTPGAGPDRPVATTRTPHLVVAQAPTPECC